MKESAITFREIINILIDRRKFTLKKVFNLMQNIFCAITGQNNLNSLPSFLLIDPSNICNLRCPACVEIKKNLPVPLTFMKKENFFRIVDEICNHTIVVALYYAGEPFLNKDICEMIQYAHKKKLFTFLSSNFNVHITKDFAEQIVDSGLDALIIAVSGFSNNIYQRMHRGGDIERVKVNIKVLQEVKKKINSKYPKIIIRYLLAKYNKEEVVDFKQFAMKYEIEFFEMSLMNFLDHDDPNSLHKEKVEKARIKNFCFWPWIMLAVHSDGTAEPCCYYNHKVPIIGNVFGPNVSCSQVWNSEIAKRFRTIIYKQGKDSVECCKDCLSAFGFQRKMFKGIK